jgi:hypothetical protein
MKQEMSMHLPAYSHAGGKRFQRRHSDEPCYTHNLTHSCIAACGLRRESCGPMSRTEEPTCMLRTQGALVAALTCSTSLSNGSNPRSNMTIRRSGSRSCTEPMWLRRHPKYKELADETRVRSRDAVRACVCVYKCCTRMRICMCMNILICMCCVYICMCCVHAHAWLCSCVSLSFAACACDDGVRVFNKTAWPRIAVSMVRIQAMRTLRCKAPLTSHLGC